MLLFLAFCYFPLLCCPLVPFARLWLLAPRPSPFWLVRCPTYVMASHDPSSTCMGVFATIFPVSLSNQIKKISIFVCKRSFQNFSLLACAEPEKKIENHAYFTVICLFYCASSWLVPWFLSFERVLSTRLRPRDVASSIFHYVSLFLVFPFWEFARGLFAVWRLYFSLSLEFPGLRLSY